MLAGVLQIALGALGFARLMRFLPRSVMIGFVNALAILIFLAQLPHLLGVPLAVYPLVALGILIIVFFPRVTRAVPAPLVAVVVITAIVGAHPAVTIVSASFAAVLGAIEGAIIFGGARFAGDRAWDQENLPNHTIVVVAILGASEHDALEGCSALTRLGATKVRVVDDAGRWRLPNIYATPE